MLNGSPEHEHSVEQGPDELEQIQNQLVNKLKERGINIDREGWDNLLPSVKFGDLNSGSEQENQPEYRPNKIFAQVDRSGGATLDRTEFSRLGEFQKQHTLLHEAGHRLDWLISATHNEHWQEIGHIIAELDPNEVSYYLFHLTEKYKDAKPEELAKIIRQEAMPELIAQFIESDGTFKGFVEARMQSGAGQPGNEAWAGVAEVDTVIAKLERFESMSDEEKETFFAEYPRLQNRFHLFVNLGEVLKDPDLMNSITSRWEGDYEDGFYDDLAMVSEMAPEPPKAPLAPIKKALPAKPIGFFDLFWIFRKD